MTWWIWAGIAAAVLCFALAIRAAWRSTMRHYEASKVALRCHIPNLVRAHRMEPTEVIIWAARFGYDEHAADDLLTEFYRTGKFDLVYHRGREIIRWREDTDAR